MCIRDRLYALHVQIIINSYCYNGTNKMTKEILLSLPKYIFKNRCLCKRWGPLLPMHASLNLALISLLSIFFGNLNAVSFLLILWATIFMIKVVDNLSKLSAFRLLVSLKFALFFSISMLFTKILRNWRALKGKRFRKL